MAEQRLRILLDGPDFDGKWTEAVADALGTLGHQVTTVRRGRKGLTERLGQTWERIRFGQPDFEAQSRASREQLRMRLSGETYDLLLSLQGPLDARWVLAAKKLQPGMRIWYWIGASVGLSPFPITRTPALIDRFLVSTRGFRDLLLEAGAREVIYLPFAVCRFRHVGQTLSPMDRRRFSGSVSLVGTAYEDRAAAVEYLNRRLDHPVRVWGRGWRRYAHLNAGPPLALHNTLKVHALSAVSLNPHHPQTQGGLNMRFFEIPAAGGFQITNEQPLLDELPFGALIARYGSLPELYEQVEYYLNNPLERARRAYQIREQMLGAQTYERRLAPLFEDWQEHNFIQQAAP